MNKNSWLTITYLIVHNNTSWVVFDVNLLVHVLSVKSCIRQSATEILKSPCLEVNSSCSHLKPMIFSFVHIKANNKMKRKKKNMKFKIGTSILLHTLPLIFNYVFSTHCSQITTSNHCTYHLSNKLSTIWIIIKSTNFQPSYQIFIQHI